MITDELVLAIGQMNVMDLVGLVKTLEKEFGVTAAPIAAVPERIEPAEPPAVEEEQTEFSVSLKEAGLRKIEVIKAVRGVISIGLREAKELVESAPAVVKDGMPRDEADSVREKLEAAGAVAEVG